MKERPILFSAPMVRAILAGEKTQTRRALKSPQPLDIIEKEHPPKSGRWITLTERGETIDQNHGRFIRCRYGMPGDRLWVRETFVVESSFNLASERDYPPPFTDGHPVYRHHDEDFGDWWEQPHYRATDPEPELSYEDGEGTDPQCRWKPSIFMPRWASRLTLTITDVRVERLRKITTADAIREGIEPTMRGEPTVLERYADLWNSINTKRGLGWDANPWVWVIEFERAA